MVKCPHIRRPLALRSLPAQLAASAVSGAVLLSSSPALAQCTNAGTDPVIVTCSGTHGILVQSGAGSVIANVQAGATVDHVLLESSAAGSVTLINNGSIANTFGGYGVELATGTFLAVPGGSISYSGSGNVQGMSGLFLGILGSGSTGSIAFNATGGSVQADTGMGVWLEGTGTGGVSYMSSGGHTITSADTAIYVTNSASAANTTIVSGSAITSTTALYAMLVAHSATGDVLVTSNGAIDVSTGSFAGIRIVHSGTGNVTTNVNADLLAAQNGVMIELSNASNRGIATVNVNAAINAAGSGINIDAKPAFGAPLPGTHQLLVGAAGRIIAGLEGVRLRGTGLNLINAGSISGSSGVAVSGFLTGINTGRISGLTGVTADGGSNFINAGSIAGTGGTALRFNGKDNTLELRNGFSFTGNVIGGATVIGCCFVPVSTFLTNTLVLGGSENGSFDVSRIGTQFIRFGTLAKAGSSTWTLSGTTTAVTPWYINQGALSVSSDANLGASSGGLNFNGGTLRFGAAFDLASSRTIMLNAGGGTIDTNGFSTNLGQALAGTGGLTKAGAGTLTLAGNNTYTGDTIVNAGRLVIAQGGSLVSAVTVNGGSFVNNGISLGAMTIGTGGTLGGNGTFGSTTIAGGTLSPGNSIGTLTIQGNLVLTSASTYMVEVDPAGADRTNVTGTATLGGARVAASFANGSYVARRYTIVNAQGGVSGTFASLVNTNLPSGFTSSLTYDANNAYLDIALIPPSFSPLTVNQRNVANGLINSFNNAGGIPLVFGALSATGLTQVSGEHATGAQQTTFDAMDKFVNVLTDPFMGTRAGAEGDAYAAFKAPPKAMPFERRWSVWGAGYGGTQQTNGDGGVGSQKFTNHVYGGAAGIDYRLTPETMLGFALGGAGTTFGLANGLGSGRSEVFQAGLHGRYTSGPAYVSGAVAWGWQDIATNRTVFANGYRASFDANAITGRVEGGWRFAHGTSGITPYAAGQVTGFFLPGYTEQLVAGANTFALAYTAKDITASRTELGLRADTSFTVADAIVTLRGRAAWAHNFNTERSISALFQTLPASGFTVFGASPAQDSALVSAVAETKWLNGFSVAATFEGEFSGRTESYAGKGTLHYRW